MQNIPLFEQVFNKGKDKKIAGLPYSILWQQSTLVHYTIFPSNKDQLHSLEYLHSMFSLKHNHVSQEKSL